MNNEFEASVNLIDVIKSAVKKIEEAKENEGLELISDEELRRRLKVSRTTLFNWRLTGVIPYKRIGRKLFYPWKEIIKKFNNRI
jgi:hypothetical protein